MDYKTKYLKYKKKYISLKNQQIGGNKEKLIYIFDFDQTLMMTAALGYIKDKNGEVKCSITSHNYVDIDEKVRNQINDYSEFTSNLVTIQKMQEGCIIKKYGDMIKSLPSENIGILTARMIIPSLLKKFLENKFEIKLNLENVIASGNSGNFSLIKNDLENIDENSNAYIFLKKFGIKYKLSVKDLLKTRKADYRKAISIIWFINRGFSDIYFYDDTPENVLAVNDLNEISKSLGLNISIKSILITDEERLECIPKINKKLEEDDLYRKTNLSSKQCKEYLSSITKT